MTKFLAISVVGILNSIAGAEPGPASGGFDPSSVLIWVDPGESEAIRDLAFATIGVESAREIPSRDGRLRGLIHLRLRAPVAEFAVQWLPIHLSTRAISLDYHRKLASPPNDPLFSEQWALQNTGQTVCEQVGEQGNDVNAINAWGIEEGASSVVVAIIDSGVGCDHEDLSQAIWTNSAEATGNPGVDDDLNGYIDDQNGWDFGNGDSQPCNLNCLTNQTTVHGSQVAGIVGATRGNELGVAGIGSCALMVLKVGVTDSDCAFIDEVTDAQILSAIAYAGENGARVVNFSFECGPENTVMAELLSEYQEQFVFVVAAGNDSRNIDATNAAPCFPCSSNLPNVICVAGSDNNNARVGGSGGSNWGATSVDIAAPGFCTLTTGLRNDPQDPWPYVLFGATSGAAPHVSGAAALLFAQDPTKTPADVIADIILSATPASDFATTGPFPVVSGGVLNIGDALQ